MKNHIDFRTSTNRSILVGWTGGMKVESLSGSGGYGGGGGGNQISAGLEVVIVAALLQNTFVVVVVAAFATPA